MQNSIKYLKFAEKLYSNSIISDAWIEGKERFLLEPIILDKNQYDNFCDVSEKIGLAYDEMCQIIIDKPELIDYFNLTEYQELLWLASGGLWHGIARLDLFILEDDSILMCEMNSDTPSGEAEAVLLNEIISSDYPNFSNPNKDFSTRFIGLIDFYKNLLNQEERSYTVGIIYPTEIPEDLSMIKIYEKWLLESGYNVVLGSPFNLINKEGFLYLFDQKIDILFRHYKTDWWTERISVWTDFEYSESYPLDMEIMSVLNAYTNNNVIIINPFGAVVTQNKFSMSFFYDYYHLFSESSKSVITKYIPETRRLMDLDLSKLNKDEWVLKSDYGCEGDGVVIGNNISEDNWIELTSKMVKDHWIAQKYFKIKKYNEKYLPNFGLYLIAGKTSGIYTRLDESSTKYNSISVATLIKN